MMITMRGTDYETARLASAMKGHLAEQKAVIVFQPNEPGAPPSGHFMASWDVDDDATTSNAKLKENGVTFHTLQPLDGGGTRIFVYGEDQESYDSVGRAAAAYQSKFEVVYGAGEFLGTTKEDGTDAEQRKDAQRVYEEAIGSAAGSGGRDVGAIWKDVRDHWSAAFGSKVEGSAASKEPGAEPGKAGAAEAVAKAGEEQTESLEGYSKNATVKNGVIHTTDVDDAAKALNEGRRVELDQVRSVSVLLDRLAAVAERMIQRGEKAPTVDLCKLSVAGTNLFCAESKGIPRIEMPQMDEATTKKFIEHLTDTGHKVTNEDQYASYLRATQNELNGGKVAGIAKSMRGDKKEGPETAQVYKAPRMVVSNDDYILDGHHRWAAKVGNDSIDGILTNDTKIEISRVDMTITQLLEAADKFTGGKGRKGVGDRRFAKDFNPHHEPAGSPEGGRFASAGGSGGGGTESESGGAGGETAGLDPEVIDVGGDKWNRDTAIRLEREYQKVKPHLEKLADDVVSGNVTVRSASAPHDWESVSPSGQEKVQKAYAEWAYDSYHQSEVDNWYSEQASKDAARMVVDDFNQGRDTEWVRDALTGLQEDDGIIFPLSNEDLVEAILLYNLEGEGPLQVDFNETHLKKLLSKAHPDEPQFAGFEEPDAAKLLTKEMRSAIETTLKANYERAVENVQNDMEPPEYLADSAKEMASEDFDNLDDDQKYEWAKEHVLSDDDDEETDTEVTMPSTFDPLGPDPHSHSQKEGQAYRATGALGKAMAIARAAQVLVERGLVADDGDMAERRVQEMAEDLWEAWKGSSTSRGGIKLQAAIADELGGRIRDEIMTKKGVGVREAKDYPMVKAYVRGLWETTQWLLDKADKDKIQLYRGVMLPAEMLAKTKQERPPQGYTRLPELSIVRNGAASTTVDANVANSWNGVGIGDIIDPERVVLRAEVPRTAVVSVPVYGQNEQAEREVVIAGTSWVGWDAWKEHAPSFKEVPVRPTT